MKLHVEVTMDVANCKLTLVFVKTVK